jgi:hypothetical protein
VNLDECVEVHVGKEAHDELAIHAIGHATVSGDRVAKILDLESSLEARGEETAKGSNERCKSGKGQGMQLHRRKREGEAGVWWQEEELWELVGVRYEDGIDIAFEAAEDIGAKILQVG